MIWTLVSPTELTETLNIQLFNATTNIYLTDILLSKCSFRQRLFIGWLLFSEILKETWLNYCDGN